MRVLTRAEVEDQILSIGEAMEQATYEYEDRSIEAAEAEADYKYAVAECAVLLASHGQKMTVADRQTRIDMQCDQQFRVWKLAEARRQALKETLLTLRARMDALRTLNASIRAQT